jgi:hypothetical protein
LTGGYETKAIFCVPRKVVFTLKLSANYAPPAKRSRTNFPVRLREIAKRERRSLSAQVEVMLEKCVEREDHERKTGAEKGERRK